MHGSAFTTTSLADLARRAPFRLGETLIAPATRVVSGPGGTATLEPRVMQVLVALADADGAVVTREDLTRRCWNGQFVGDDALNRAVGEVRKVARAVAGDGFAVDTIPKTGYRLSARAAVDAPVLPAATIAAIPTAVSRRGLFMGGIAVAAGLAAWRFWPDGNARRVASLVAAAEYDMHQDLPDPGKRGVAALREASALVPGDAAVLAKLAIALAGAAEFGRPGDRAAAVADSEAAARAALAVQPRQPDALAALALLQPEFGDWLAAERRWRAVLAVDPANDTAAAALAVVLQGAGRTRESAALTLGLAARFPLAPKYRYRLSYALWSNGQLGAADRNIDNATELWPRHPAIWFTRLWLLALNDRAAAALAMLDDRGGWPMTLTAGHAAGLRVSLVAIASRSAADIRAAVAENFRMVLAGPSWAVFAVMILSRLGELDAAFAIADGYLLRRGAHVGLLRHTAAQPSVNDQRHRKTMMLFIPATAPLRADPRFLPLCRDIGLVDYWQRSGKRPDFLGDQPLA